MRVLPIILTIIFTTLGQLVFKKGINTLVVSPGQDIISILKYFIHGLMNGWIFSGFVLALCAAFSWMLALRNYELSSAYPFQSLNFILVPMLSILLYSESFNSYKLIGILIIVFGIIIFSKGI